MSKNIKICHITTVHKAEDDRIFIKECVSLAKNEYTVFLVAPGNSYNKLNVNIIGVGDKPKSFIKRLSIFTIKAYKSALKTDSVIYHIHDPELLFVALILKINGKKVIFDSHEFYSQQILIKQIFNKYIRIIISKLYSIFELFVFSIIDAVIIPCTINGINPYMHRAKYCEVIGNMVKLEEIYNLYIEKCKNTNLACCYIGGLTKERGITNNICACYKSNTKLILAGNFNSAEYQNTISNMKEFTCVEYRGILDRKGVVKVLQESNIGLCTLLSYGQYLFIDAFGVKVYEYMAMGLPVILSHSIYNDMMIKKYNFGICVNPDNINEISSAINMLIENDNLRTKMGNNGRKLIKEQLNWENEEKKLLNLYKKILYEK